MKKFIFYYYDSEKLLYRRVKTKYIIGSILIFLLIVSFIVKLLHPTIFHNSNFMDYEPNTIVINVKDTTNDFTEEKLIDLLKTLNIKHPHIVLAQAKLESGHFTSKIFKENHNLFGMKEARVRINTANGTQYNHAYYSNWRESVYDYAFYQCRYLGRINTEEEYFSYLNQNYAESPNYVQSLKTLIEKEKLKDIFDS
jgi:hypothetical protein